MGAGHERTDPDAFDTARAGGNGGRPRDRRCKIVSSGGGPRFGDEWHCLQPVSGIRVQDGELYHHGLDQCRRHLVLRAGHGIDNSRSDAAVPPHRSQHAPEDRRAYAKPHLAHTQMNLVKAAGRIVAERLNPAAVSHELWKGVVRFNRQQAGPLRYKRTVISVRDVKGRLLGGLILQSYWRESYIELLWLSALRRNLGLAEGQAQALLREAPALARA